MTETEATAVEVELEDASESSPLDDVEESDRAPLLMMVRKVAEISRPGSTAVPYGTGRRRFATARASASV